MKYTPYSDTRIIKIIVLLLALSSLILMGFSLATDNFSSSILKTVAIIPFSAATLVAIRFGICSYTYILEDYEFIVVQRLGKKIRTVCRLYYTDITDIICFDDATDKIKGRIRYNYRVKILPSKSYCLFYVLGNENGVILFEPDENFVKVLRKYIQNDILND